MAVSELLVCPLHPSPCSEGIRQTFVSVTTSHGLAHVPWFPSQGKGMAPVSTQPGLGAGDGGPAALYANPEVLWDWCCDSSLRFVFWKRAVDPAQEGLSSLWC